jgi:hypothetical protein
MKTIDIVVSRSSSAALERGHQPCRTFKWGPCSASKDFNRYAIVIKSDDWIFNVYKLIIMMSDQTSASPLTQGKPVISNV